MNGTPFVRQYGILDDKWGVLLCQKEYLTKNNRQNSRSPRWKLCGKKSRDIAKQLKDLEFATSSAGLGATLFDRKSRRFFEGETWS